MACSAVQAGANVAVIDSLEDPHRDFSYIQSIGPMVKHYRSDVTSYEDLQDTFNQIVRDFGDLHGCVAAAGICPDEPFLRRDPQAVKRVIDVNVLGTYYTAQLAAKQMASQSAVMSGGTAGSIVLIASIAAHRGLKAQFFSDYCASKGAVRSLTRALAGELAPSNIRINSISPGYTMTDMTADLMNSRPELANVMMTESPMGRMADRCDFKGATVYLLSNASAYVTGSEILIDGGFLAGRNI